MSSLSFVGFREELLNGYFLGTNLVIIIAEYLFWGHVDCKGRRDYR